MVVGFFPISVSLVIALESFVGEKERRSIEPLLSSPLTDLQLYLGKLLAVMVPPLMASYLGVTVYLIGVYRQIGWVPDAILLAQVIVLSTVQSLLMVSGAVVISSQTTSARAANLLSSFIIVPMAILLIGESMIMFWANYDLLWWLILGQVLIAGLLVRTGVAHFNREELLGRELDSLNFRWAWKIFALEFKGEATSLASWYRGEVRKSLKKHTLPIALILGVLLIMGLIGTVEAQQYTLPPDMLSLDYLDQGFVQGGEGIETIHFFSVDGVWLIWFHNLRAISIATVLALFSFGVLGVLIVLLPFPIIGFFAGLMNQAGLPPLTFLAAFILPHGIAEIPAIVLAGASILRLGATLATPARGKTISEALLLALADWARIMLALVMPLLLVAALLEIFITPRVALLLLGQ
jgi:uncharacterized membrane protein SpoIIM required for sporulation